MEPVQRINELAALQREQLQELENIASAIDASDLVGENRALRERCEQIQAAQAAMQGKLSALLSENHMLKERLFEQMYAQRSTLLSGAKRQTEILFAQEENTAVNALAAYNKDVWQRIGALRQQLTAQNAPGMETLLAQLAEVEATARDFMRSASGRLNQNFDQARSEAETGYAQMNAQPFTPVQLERKLKDNNIELRIGGRITNIVGLCFILLAVVFGLRYTFLSETLSQAVKGIVAYAIGGVFLFFGEMLSRRQKNYFSLGLCAGGVGVLFAATAVSYFNLGILPKPAAIILCMLTTIIALFLSYRYDAQIIAVFALVGGYLPMTALDGSAVMIFSAMLYFLLLSLMVLFVALRKNWRTIRFFCLFFSGGAILYLLRLQGFAPVAPNIVYILANFLLYTAIVLVYPILNKKLLRPADTILLGINTWFSCGFIFLLLNYNGLDVWNGPVALIFCALFFLLAFGLRFCLSEDAGARGFFYATSFAFWVLAVPLQFDTRLITLGWLCEGVALSVFGVISGRKWYRRAGYAISLLCFISFVFNDMLIVRRSVIGEYFYAWRFSAVVLGALIILVVLIYKAMQEGRVLNSVEGVFKVFALVGTWIYLLWISKYLIENVFIFGGYRSFAFGVAATGFTIGCAILYRVITPLGRKSVEITSTILFFMGFFFTVILNANVTYPLFYDYYDPAMENLARIVLIVFNLAVVFVLYHFMRLIFKTSASPEWPPFIAGAFGVILLLQIMTVQFSFRFTDMWVSFVLIAWALAMIITGFIQRYSYMRRIGLGFSLLSITKLFFIDLYGLASGQRVISYFVFGIVFIAISYLYQLFSRKLFPTALEEPKE